MYGGIAVSWRKPRYRCCIKGLSGSECPELPGLGASEEEARGPLGLKGNESLDGG